MAVHPSIAAGLLAWASATDNREVTEAASIAWAEALDDRVTLPDGKAAITAHRSRSGEWLMPSHVNAGVHAIRKARLDAMQTPQPPEALDGHPRRELAWQRAYREAVGDGYSARDAMDLACATVNIPVQPPALPASRPVELHLAHGAQCEHGCLTQPVRASEGAE